MGKAAGPREVSIIEVVKVLSSEGEEWKLDLLQKAD